MKTDNRPIKIECFLRCGTADHTKRTIGSLLLPIRGVNVITSMRNMQLKLHWHKLSGVNGEWRKSKPEVYLLLCIVRKSLVVSGQFEAVLGRVIIETKLKYFKYNYIIYRKNMLHLRRLCRPRFQKQLTCCNHKAMSMFNYWNKWASYKWAIIQMWTIILLLSP